MSVVDELVEVEVKPQNKNFYISKGYEVGEVPYILTISTRDLPSSSTHIVTVVCESCNKERKVQFKRAGNDCGSCASKKRGGERKDLSKTTCSCGNKKSYQAKGCRSCVDREGENNPMFGKKNEWLTKWNKSHTSDNHWNWQGGISKDRSSRQIVWAKKVKERDNNTCQVCAYDNKLTLDAHHYESVDRFSDEHSAYGLDNGVCLCKNCHTIFHKTYGYGNNTKEQYIEFKEKMNG